MNYIQDNFHTWTPVIRTYSNGRTAVEYWSESEYGPECECIASVNLPFQGMEEDEIGVKDYSENEGLYECMLTAGHISPAIRYVDQGFISIPICKLLIK